MTVYTQQLLRERWARLHRGDGEPFPADAGAVSAWLAFHSGDFAAAAAAGREAGGAGLIAAMKADAMAATYMQHDAERSHATFERIVREAAQLQQAMPLHANAWYVHGYALGRYAQRLPITRALAENIAQRVKASLDRTVALAPFHADAQIALGTYHVEIIGKVGALVAALTYGAKPTAAIAHYEAALGFNADSIIARIEYAKGLLVLQGKKAASKAHQLYAAAAAWQPLDAAERFDVALAQTHLSAGN